jgi:hypothetical protein
VMPQPLADGGLKQIPGEHPTALLCWLTH